MIHTWRILHIDGFEDVMATLYVNRQMGIAKRQFQRMLDVVCFGS